jgi:hypothetical protein
MDLTETQCRELVTTARYLRMAEKEFAKLTSLNDGRVVMKIILREIVHIFLRAGVGRLKAALAALPLKNKWRAGKVG